MNKIREMGFFRLGCLLSAILLLSINSKVFGAQDDKDRKVYIVYMGSLPSGETLQDYNPTSHHLTLLNKVIGVKSLASASSSLIRSYKRSFNGFAAKLTQEEAEKLASKGEVQSVFPSITFHPQTTRSWDFIGLPLTAKRKLVVEYDTIIGVLDTGLDPTAESFSGKGFGPPPAKWKGSCKGGANFTCNNKLIGAKNYVPGDQSAVDVEGHGTHTASTAAGNVVDGANFFGMANGTARGGVPSSRISVYRVCGTEGCTSEQILAGFDDAIADGVDIITVSLGWKTALHFDKDAIAIGGFHAMEKGILVTQSAGNNGPNPETLNSVAPWLLTVAGSSIDRKFISKLVLADGTTFTGLTVNGFPSLPKDTALVYGKDAAKNSSDELSAQLCSLGSLDARKIAGKIVICEGDLAIIEAITKNASGIVQPGFRPGIAYSHAIPAVDLNSSSIEKLVSYYKSTRNPHGRILKGETASDPDSPAVAHFSSRGPNIITPDIMKPDISAPGTDILAAYPPNVSPTQEGRDPRSVKFNVISGTSMACPHVAGAAAYIKTFHPDWSPSAIKSALMTTASKVRDGEFPMYEFSYGSGQINPAKAVNPGLVYEITKDDYVKLLCSLGYNVRRIDSNSTCPKGGKKKMTEAELNYPSVTFKVPHTKPIDLAVKRTVTNVWSAKSTYKAKVVSPSNLNVSVVPDVLSFTSVSEKKSFSIKIVGANLVKGAILSGELVWSDGVHGVRSPIVVYAGNK